MRRRALAGMIVSALMLVGCTGGGSKAKVTATTPVSPTTATVPATQTTQGMASSGGSFTASSAPDSDGSSYCVVLTSTGVDCWGSGQLGDGKNEDSNVAVAVVAVGGAGSLSGVNSVVSGGGSYCAVLTSGGLDCWGSGVKGAGGDVPAAVVGVGGAGSLSGVKGLYAGGGTNCAVFTSGGVDCWGKGTYGVLGDGATSDSDIPVAVKAVGGTGALTGVESVVIDNFTGSSCALLTSGGVDCWGGNGLGELGDGTTKDSDVPVAVVGVGRAGTLSGVKSVANAGGNGYCAVLISGGVDCWGGNSVGQLGNGAEGTPYQCGASCSTSPVAVVGVGKVGTLTGVASLVGALSSYCALLTSGGVDCWGQGMYGELGDGTNVARNRTAAPVAVAGVKAAGALSGVKSVATDGRSYCAVLTSGGLDCWGDNLTGELGDGITTGPESCLTLSGRHPCSTKPVAVNGVIGNGPLLTVESVSNSGDSYCALLKSGGLDCWGDNSQGQLGNGTTTPSDIPVYVPAPA